MRVRPRQFAAGAFILRAAAGIFCPARGGAPSYKPAARPLPNPPPVLRITFSALPYNSGMKFLLRHRALLSALGVILIVLTAFCCCFFALGSAASQTLKPVVVLDAGHGGIDAGVRGTLTGVKESDLNLSFVRILQEKFEAAGFEAVLTRKTEAGLYGTTAPGHKKRDMAARAAIVKEASPALVLSVHQNFFSDSARRGAQAFYLLGSASSKALACSLQSALNRMPECVKKTSPVAGDYFILKCSGAPSAIVECGFLSNPDDEKLLLEESYREKLASAVFEGALTYLSSAS